jgi:WD40 repeat protein
VGSGHEARLTVWDAASGELLWSRSEPRFPAIVSVAFHPGGRFLAAGYGEYNGKSAGQVKLWEVATGREICALASSKKAVNKLAFHPDGKRLAIADWEHVEIWDIDARAKIRDLRAHTYWVRREAPDDGSNSVAFSHDGKWLATGGWDRTIRLWDAELGAEMPTVLGEHDGFVTDLAFSPDSRFLASTSEDRSVKLWGVPTGRRVAAFHGHSDHVFCVAFRPDGQELATGGLDGTVKIWNLKKSRPVVFDRHTTAVPDVAFRRDGHRVLSHPAAKGLHAKQALGERTMVWDPVTGDLDSALTGVNFQAHREEFELDVGVGKPTATSPDGQHVALIVTDGKLDRVSERSTDFAGNAVEIRASGSGQVIHRLIGHTGGVTCMAFSPDGQRLATASVDRTIKLWDVATGREVFTLRGHTAGVLSMAFSPDGHRTASGGIDNAVRIWDATLLPDDVLQPLEARFQQKLEKFWDMTHATDDFQRAADGQNTLGTQFANMGSLYEAIACFRMAIKIDPKHRNAFTNLGIAYYRQGNVDAAIASYRKAIDLDPEHASAHSNLGIALTAQGKPTRRSAASTRPSKSTPNTSTHAPVLG